MSNRIDYSVYDKYQSECKHGDWIKICVYCGLVLEDTENKVYSSTGALKNETVFLYWDFDRYDENPVNGMID